MDDLKNIQLEIKAIKEAIIKIALGMMILGGTILAGLAVNFIVLWGKH